MKLAFILDPLDQLKAYKDSSIAMMRAAARRGHEVFAIQRDALVWDGGTVSAQALAITPTDGDDAWYVPGAMSNPPLSAFDAELNGLKVNDRYPSYDKITADQRKQIADKAKALAVALDGIDPALGLSGLQ